SSIGATASSPTPEGSNEELEACFADNFNRINWSRLLAYTKPLRTQKFKKLTLYKYSYQVALRTDIRRIFFIYRYYHIHSISSAASSNRILETTSSTTSA
ncbi:hypothetical protein GQ44DRAFT_615805, partial [Phaeosphaeriaceae sp. PMI808]